MQLMSEHRVVILLHEGISGTQGKTGLAYLRYGQASIVAVIDAQNAGQSLEALTGIPQDIPIVAHLQDALQYSPNVLLIGIAPSGGILPDSWFSEVKLAVEKGISIVNGLHTPLSPQFSNLKQDQWIWDIRQEPSGLRVGKARAKSLSCQRILTVGTDMSVGKMSTSIELNRLALKRGLKSKFLATGQGGIMISGGGIPLDAVRVDFAAGAVEQIVLDSACKHDILWIEGQGSLLHPGSTATLPLLRGSQPTALVLVHRFGQVHIKDLPEILIPSLTEVIKLYEMVAWASGTFAPIKIKAISLNTFALSLEDAIAAIKQVKAETGLPCTDVVRFGGEILLDAILEST